jgi:WD40 repeat protein
MEATAGMTLSPEARLKYGASATEQEIAHGALASPDAVEHVFCYFRRIANLGRLRAEATTSEEARTYGDFDGAGTLDQEARTCGLALKGRLADALGNNVRHYEARWEAGQLSSNHIARLCAEVYADLERVILIEVARLAATTSLAHEHDAHEAFGQERAAMFVGREGTLRRIAAYLRGASTHPLILCGPSGSGKSAVMARAAQKAAAKGGVLVQRFVGTTPQSSDGRGLLHSLAQQMASGYDSTDPIPEEYEKLANAFSQRLAMATAERPLVLFIDALDQLPERDPALRLAWLPSALPPNVRIILSMLSTEPPKAIAHRFPPAAWVRIEPMPLMEGGALLDRWLAGAERTLQPQQRREVLEAFEADGLPLYLKIAFEEARRWQSFTPRGRAALGKGLQEIIRDLLLRLETDHGPTLVGRSLSLLAASRNGLSEDETLDLLSLDTDVVAEFRAHSPKCPDLGSQPRLPAIVWSRLHHDLGPYLSERAAEGATVLSFYHRQLADGASERYLTPRERGLSRHADLASYFGGQPLVLQRAEGTTHNRRRCWEQPYQELHSERWEALEATLTDLGFVEAKCAVGLTWDLLADYARCGIQEMSQGPPILTARAGSSAIGYLCPNCAAWNAVGQEDLGAVTRCRACASTCRLNPFVIAGKCSVPQVKRYASGLPAKGRALAAPAEGTRTARPMDAGEPSHATLGPFFSFLRRQAHILSEQAPATLQLAANEPDDSIVSSRAIALVREQPRPWFQWTNKPQASDRCLMILTGHRGPVLDCECAPNGALIASASADASIRVWQAATGVVLTDLREHGGPVNACHFTPDGLRLITASDDGTLRVWDVETMTSIAVLRGHSGPVHACAVSAGGKRAASVGEDGTLRIWDLRTFECRHVIDGDCSRARFCLYSPDGLWIVSTRRGELWVWDAARGRSLGNFDEHNGQRGALPRPRFPECCVFTPDGTQLLTGAFSIERWSAATGTAVCSGPPLEGVPDNRYVAGPGANAFAVACAYSPDGARVAASYSATADQWEYRFDTGRTAKLQVWDVASGRCVATFHGHSGQVNACSWSPDGQRLVSGANDGTLRVWSSEWSGTVAGQPGGCGPIVTGCAFSPDGGEIACGSMHLSRFRSTDGAALTTLSRDRLERIPEWIRHIRYVSGSDKILVAGEQGLALLRTPGTVHAHRGRASRSSPNTDVSRPPVAVEATLAGYPLVLEGTDFWCNQQVPALVLTPDCQRVAFVFASEPFVRQWDLRTSGCLAPEERPVAPAIVAWGNGRLSSIEYSPDGSLLAAAGERRLGIWAAATWAAALRPRVTAGVCSSSFSPDGTSFVSVSEDGTVTYWDLQSGRKRWSARHRVWDVQHSPDGRRLVGARCRPFHPYALGTVVAWPRSGGPHDLHMWDVRTGKRTHVLRGHTSWITAFAFSVDGRWIVSASADRTVRLWCAKTGKGTACFWGDLPYNVLAVAPAETLFAAGDRAGALTLLRLRGHAEGPPIVTPAHQFHSTGACFDSAPTVRCGWCGKVVKVPARVLGTIGSIHLEHKVTERQSPILRLPSRAWDEPALLGACPSCHGRLRFNPFVVDSRDRYPARRAKDVAPARR